MCIVPERYEVLPLRVLSRRECSLLANTKIRFDIDIELLSLRAEIFLMLRLGVVEGGAPPSVLSENTAPHVR